MYISSMYAAEEIPLFVCAAARNEAQALGDPQIVRLRESYDEIREKP